MEKRKKPRFLRKDWHKCIRLGRKKSNRVWRMSKGRHGKLRQKWKNHTKMPSIGYGSPNEIRGMIMGMKPVMVSNMADLMNVGKDQIAIISGKVGLRKKVEMAKKALTMNIKFSNFNPQKVLDMAKTLGSKASKQEEKKTEKVPKETESKKHEETKGVSSVPRTEGSSA
ncbi:MAG: 50S ribosomal protein L32e [Nanoarchaeota archaeon]|nr:50S ribosomal protein L32e [Nanoarchaeota archaeon]